MRSPYDYPHICEKESLAAALNRLSRQQQRALRSYVWKVQYGEMSLAEWLAEEADSPATSTWYKKPGNYWHHDGFRAALDAYVAAAQGWQVEEESRVVGKANHKIRMAADRAADTILALMDDTQQSGQVRLKASESILDRSDSSTASKAAPGSQVTVYIPDNARDTTPARTPD